MVLDYNEAFYETNLGMQARGGKKLRPAFHKHHVLANELLGPLILNTCI